MSAALSSPTSASSSMLDIASIAQHAADISEHAGRLEILLQEVFDKLDAIEPRDKATRGAVDAVECFTTCALRNGVLMRDAADQIAALVAEGGEA